MRILVDSDVLVDHLRGHRRFEPHGNEVFVSSVTRAELFSGNPADEARVVRLLEPMHEIGVDRLVAERAGRLRRTLPVRLADALIAATALEHDLALLTRNRRDFEAIQGLAFSGERRHSVTASSTSVTAPSTMDQARTVGRSSSIREQIT